MWEASPHLVVLAGHFVGPRPHPSPFGPQAPQDRLFPDAHVELPGYGGDFYENYYGDD